MSHLVAIESNRRGRIVRCITVSMALCLAAGGASVGAATSDSSGDDGVDQNISGGVLRVFDFNLIGPLLEASGADEDLPYSVEVEPFTQGSDALQALGAGVVDVGINSDVGLATGLNGGVNMVAIGVVDRPGENCGVLVSNDSDAETVADLVGQRVAITDGNASTIVLLGALEAVDLTLDDLELVRLRTGDAQSAFASGDVDAWATCNPTLGVSREQLDARILVDGGEYWAGYNGWYVNRDSLNDPDRSAMIAHFVRTINELWGWAAEHRDAFLEAQSAANGLPVEVNALQFDTGPTVPVRITDEVIAEFQKTADGLVAYGVIDPVDVEPAFALEWNDELFESGR